MAGKFIFREEVGGNLKEKEGLQVSTGAADAGAIPALNADGKLDITMMPAGVGEDAASFSAAEALAAGDLVYVGDDVGTAKVYKASGDVSGEGCMGFVKNAYTVGESATVYFEGVVTGLSNLSIGSRYYLSDTTAGKVVSTPVTGTGKIHQYVGRAVSTTEISFEPDDVIILA